MQAIIVGVRRREAWDRDKLVGQKAPFELKQLWAGRIRLLAGWSISPGWPLGLGKARP